MGKKDHPPRKAGAAKKPLPVNAVPDTDYIVFGNDKPKKQAPKPGGDGATKAGPSTGGPDQPPPPPKPDARKIIGGASWTGKLPQTLLQEHCQKQKWMKPDFSMRQIPGGGYQSTVTLSSKNTKTGEVTTLPPFHLPPAKREISTEPSALEARHFASAWALFRISSMKNIHMMLPPKYRDLWKGDFQEIKQDDIKAGLAWMYAADPFAAHLEKEAAKAEAQKKREALAKEREKAAKEEKASSVTPTGSASGQRGSGKGGQQVQTVELGTNLRSEIEEMVRRKAIWNPYEVKLPQNERKSTIQHLVDMGFRKSHVEEALEQCKDQEEALEWLLIYVPEDDLPQWAFPEGYSTGITFASGNLAKEASLKRLAEGGYPMDECERAYKLCNNDEHRAGAMLQAGLRHQAIPEQISEGTVDENVWDEELVTLESIFADRFSSNTTKASCTVSLTLPGKSIQVRFVKPVAPYPSVPPTVSIISRELPAYIRLSATRKVLEWADSSMIGEPMMFGIVDWLETSIPDIEQNPGKLRDIALSDLSLERKTGGAPNTVSQGRGRNNRQRKANPEDNQSILENWKMKHTTPEQQKMLKARQSLPAWNMSDEIVHAVNAHQVTIISGETGSGKSTQSVQFILDDMIEGLRGAGSNIMCTQPRRISALGLADRVGAERCSAVGDEVGYVIRGDSKVSSSTKITFMTTGVLLRRLQSFDMSGSLADVTHIFVDEVHERSLDTDFLLALLRDALQHNKHLKVVLMSATLDAEAFVNYFGGQEFVGTVHIPGRTYPVHDHYLDDVVHMTKFNPRGYANDEDDDKGVEASMSELTVGKTIQNLGMGINYDLIGATVRHIDQTLGRKDGAILIFLPGTLEIDRCLRAISDMPNVHALPLHASLMPSEQKMVFLQAPGGKRKVIAATNVAETSITIEDVVAVIDTGRVKETRYDSENRVVRLEEVWASQAACKQRRGRAGRVRAGTCYKLFTRKIEQEMAPRPLPEIRRVPLEQLCLSVKATDEERDVAGFLRQTLTPPEEGAVDVAIQLLHQIGALQDSHLTALGRFLALIPADLRCAKLLVYGSIFGCLESCLTIASILTVRSPFLSPRDKREEAQAARATFSDGSGDLLLDLAAYNEWSERSVQSHRRDAHSWCSAMFLSSQTLRDISSTRSQLLSSLKDAGIVSPQYRSNNFSRQQQQNPFTNNNVNNQDTNIPLLRALVAASLHPQTAHISFPSKKFAASHTGAVELDPEARTIKYFDHPPPPQPSAVSRSSSLTAANAATSSRIFIHPSSVLFTAQQFPSTTTFLAYFTKLSTSKLFIRDLTPFNLYTLLLFGSGINLNAPTPGRSVADRGLMSVDGGWIKVRGWARIGVLVARLRILLDDVLRRRVECPLGVWEGDDRRIVELVGRVLVFNGMDR